MIEFHEVAPDSRDALMLMHELNNSLRTLFGHDGTQYLRL